jgi:DNA-binding CsgD family transcriptional regulator
MNLVAEDWKAINGCLLRLYRELDHEKLLRLILEITTELVPGESAALSVVTLDEFVRCILLPENFMSVEDLGLVAQFRLQSPFRSYIVATRDAQWKMTTDFIPLEDFQFTDLYQRVFVRYGISQQMAGVLAVDEKTWHAIVINRRALEPFTEREREILNTLQPHLAVSYVNAVAHGQARESIYGLEALVENAPDAYGYFHEDGKLAWLQDKAAAWLDEFFPDEVKTAEKIPQSINRLHRASMTGDHAPKSLEKVGGAEILTACVGGSPDGGRILRLDRRPITPPPRFRPLPQFSARKNDVLQWMVEGKRNAEIAAILHLSPRTVERHVTEILAGLSVENRATAIVRAMEFCAAANLTP